MTKRIFKDLEYCANGDGNKVCPPSKVICRECMDKISDTLTKLSNQLEEIVLKKDDRRYCGGDNIILGRDRGKKSH